ncbi:MAG: hypothetical protein GC160_04865 [Acidobacteria bacterium]|nr:hypothetical protein [Acidobacteriota bacterium]
MRRFALCFLLLFPALPAQLIERTEPPEGDIVIPRGTRIPLALINSVSTKNSAPGDRIYLESVFPVALDGRIVIPAGAYVTGQVTEVKRAGRVKGKAEMHIVFEQMILPNGVIRDFRGSLGALEGTSEETLDRESGEIKGQGGKGDDAKTVAGAASTGAGVGVIAGAAGGNPIRGLGMGSAVGAAAGLAGVLLTRGPDAVLEQGTQLEMVLDRDMDFTPEELTFDNALSRPTRTAPQRRPSTNQNTNSTTTGPLGLPIPFGASN